VPEHLAPHIDYITPGIKLYSGVKRDNVGLQKRGFGLPPLISPLPAGVAVSNVKNGAAPTNL